MGSLKKILIVDDDAYIRDNLFDLLSDEGFKVTVARDGEESLKQLKTRRFDLLITDINMPRMDGIELMQKMKKAGRKERIIVMTGKPAGYKKRKNGDMPPVFSQLRKPFHMKKFLEVVAAAFAPKRKGMVETTVKLGGRRKRM